MAETKKEIELSQKIVLRSVRGKVGNVIKIQPCKNPETGEYPECVKKVDSNDNMILSERERNVLTLRYIVGATQNEIADRLNVSQAQVSRIEKSALNKARKLIEQNIFKW